MLIYHTVLSSVALFVVEWGPPQEILFFFDALSILQTLGEVIMSLKEFVLMIKIESVWGVWHMRSLEQE
jgi:hypothetical protein